jgi:hypothetical protein
MFRYTAVMTKIEDQIRELQAVSMRQQQSIRRQRGAIMALACILGASVMVGAVRPVSDGTFDTITCKSWRVVGDDGTPRVRASVTSGAAGIYWFDRDGKARLVASVDGNGASGFHVCDKAEQHRITMAMTPGNNAILGVSDKSGKPRITAGVSDDGTVIYPTRDGE